MAIFIELFLMGVGLSMDAFAVSICKGLGMRKVNKKQALVIGLFFGGFQALMPFVGWLLGSQFEKYITSIDHWIAFILLGIIGGKMIVESVKPDKEDDEVKEMDAPLDLKEMFVLAVATSIDALAVGITFAFLFYMDFTVHLFYFNLYSAGRCLYISSACLLLRRAKQADCKHGQHRNRYCR